MEIKTRSGMQETKRKNFKNSIDRIQLYLLLYPIQEEIQKYLYCRKGELIGSAGFAWNVKVVLL